MFYTMIRAANDGLMELLIMSYTCKTSSCKSVIGVIPYLPYSQQSKFNFSKFSTQICGIMFIIRSFSTDICSF